MALHEILNPILNPLLSLKPIFIILIVSFIVSIITTLIYKYTTDQKKLKQLKDETKEYQQKIKKLSNDPEKALSIQKEMMQVNMEYMKSSFKPMFYTMIPVLLFFSWLGANLAFVPLQIDTPFDVTVFLQENVTGEINLIAPESFEVLNSETKKINENSNNLTWNLISKSEGIFDLKFQHKESGEEQIIPLIITNKQKYVNPINNIDSSIFNKITVNQKKLILFENIFLLNKIPWIKNFGWLGSYILFSMVFSTLLRKLLKIS
ncbi:MAG: EMC3/TMCO1 family protein [Candidatus Woesearchaeota archaeon]